MAKETLTKQNLEHLIEAAAHLVRLPKRHIRSAYDEEADVLYVHFAEPGESNHSEMRDDGVILDYRGDELVGITILAASQRRAPSSAS